MLIELKDAVRKYGDSEAAVYALNHASFQLEEGKICVILDPSGSGKSTLLNMLGGLEDEREYGTTIVIITHNEAISAMAHRIIWIKDGRIDRQEDNEHRTSAADLQL